MCKQHCWGAGLRAVSKGAGLEYDNLWRSLLVVLHYCVCLHPGRHSLSRTLVKESLFVQVFLSCKLLYWSSIVDWYGVGMMDQE